MSKVTVWMPLYNEARYLRDAAASVLSQSMSDLELIISDNHSTDDSGLIAADILTSDPRVRLWRPPEHLAGIPHMNWVWTRLDRGQTYTIHIGAHDAWERDHLAILCARLDAEIRERQGTATVSLVYSDCWQMNSEGQLCGRYQDQIQIGQVGRAMIPQFVIAGVNSPCVFGLWNEAVRRKLPIRHECGGWDHLIVAHAALRGMLLFEGATKLIMRSPKQGDTLIDYGRKHLNAELLEQGPRDFLNQLEWCIAMVDEALKGVPEAAKPLYKTLLTSSMAATYIALRGINLHCVPGAMTAFQSDESVKKLLELFNGADLTARAICGQQTESA